MSICNVCNTNTCWEDYTECPKCLDLMALEYEKDKESDPSLEGDKGD